MRRWWYEHSLSVVLIGLTFIYAGIWLIFTKTPSWDEFWLNFASDTYGAWIVVFMAKYFRESGSKELDE